MKKEKGKDETACSPKAAEKVYMCPLPGGEDAVRMSGRVEQKIEDYQRYEFTPQQKSALNIFFDLVQEYEDEEDFHAVCVMIPKVIFGLESSLFLLSPQSVLTCRRSSMDAAAPPFDDPQSLPSVPVLIHESFCCPIRGNHKIIDQLPFVPEEDVIGYLEVQGAGDFSEHDRLFWEKYANRIGFQQHLRMIHEENKGHLSFIQNLVRDIGHNVIVPNMYFKLFFNRLKRQIDGVGNICETGAGESAEAALSQMMKELRNVHGKLEEQFLEISRHYEQTSLYLETLLRQSHFEKGRYVLERREANVISGILRPQLLQFAPRFRDAKITLVQKGEMEPKNPELVQPVDVGLMAQVISNLLSNALKYTTASDSGEYAGKKAVYADWKILDAGQGVGRRSLKVEIASTGPELAVQDVPQLFMQGYRGGNVGSAGGTGQGLFFVRQIVELHEGRMSYERVGEWNIFYMILPLHDSES
ncbi:sensor histidine kinase [Desulfobaculum bizertense]|uniref:histidine kinase n=1 Tax=Desulfobaculum bizertense DSM 18034 TaxID=1121442 RepID=A0A1T4WAM7_9BACT|nr:HAMP domain-containing sensor histidine kinase [Desulfobaculum bizertense]SKA74340.1 Histidine kinase-, DNA gyrase B-, and HSP90-like ATPase [Desulfobaculum bizertense DSM 18034]